MGAPALVKEGLSWREVRLRALHTSPVSLAPRARRRRAAGLVIAPLLRGGGRCSRPVNAGFDYRIGEAYHRCPRTSPSSRATGSRRARLGRRLLDLLRQRLPDPADEADVRRPDERSDWPRV